MLDLQQIPIPSQDFCVRQVGDEFVFLAESGDEYISLNPVGSFIWQQVDGVHSLRDILDILCDEYEVRTRSKRWRTCRSSSPSSSTRA
jgi:hypothetical protein